MRVIREDLHCTAAVWITGGDPDRLEIAARHAAEAGLEVRCGSPPFACDPTVEQVLALIADCARRAERLRRGGAEVVFLTGAELGLMVTGFLPGDTFVDRAPTAPLPRDHAVRSASARMWPTTSGHRARDRSWPIPGTGR